MKHLAALGTLVTATLSLTACAGDATGSGEVTVDASDSACKISVTDINAGPSTLKVTNTGSKVTEFYIYAEGGRVMGEVENIRPGLSRRLVVDLPVGTYEGVCKPGMVGDGIRHTLKVTGKAGDVDEAKRLYPVARTYWERIEPVAEKFGDLDPLTDGREGDAKAENRDFTGWHRLERQLWVEGNTHGMAKYADDLLVNIKKIVALGQDTPLTAVELAQGSKALLDEVATGKITGEEDIFSHTDLWDFKANIEGSQAAIAALRPLLVQQDPELLLQIEDRFETLDTDPYQHLDADGDWTSYDKLTNEQVKTLSDRVSALSEPISRVAAVIANSA